MARKERPQSHESQSALATASVAERVLINAETGESD
mgnify:CR=1 FL=1